MRNARKNTGSVSRQATGVAMVPSETNDRRICVLSGEYVKTGRAGDRQTEKGKDTIHCHPRFSDGCVLTTGYSLQSSGELLRCNCLLLLLSNSCHFHVALPLPGLV